METITRSGDIIAAISKSVKQETGYDANRASNLAYAKAFGFAWAILSEEQREMMLEYYLGTEKLLNL
jgi:hypothetical protein